MFRIFYWLIMVLCIVSICGCATITVDSDYDKSARFDRLKTYDWLPGLKADLNNGGIDGEKLDQRIRKIVEHELASKGYRKETQGKPDFFITYDAVIEKRQEVSTLKDYGVRTHRLSHTRFSGMNDVVSTRYYEEGTLVISVLDSSTKKHIWQGSIQAEVNRNQDLEARIKRIRNGVHEILKPFPPK